MQGPRSVVNRSLVKDAALCNAKCRRALIMFMYLLVGLGLAVFMSVVPSNHYKRAFHFTSAPISEMESQIDVTCWACMKPGGLVEPWSYSIATEPLDFEVDVRITHCGVCHSDLHQIDDAWGVACFPLVPGHEIVGTVVKVGSNAESYFSIGDTVGIGVQRGCCGTCEQCITKREQLCPKATKTYAGPGNDRGGFSNYIRYPMDWVFKIPSTFPRELAAPLLCAGITTFSPLKKWLPKPSTPGMKAGTVGIIGVGGLGHVAVQIAANMAENVVAISTSPAKELEARALGATDFIVSKNATQMAAFAMKFDVVLNTVSGVEDMDAYLALLKPEGTMVCVGLPEKTKKVGVFMQSFVATERKIVGSYLGPKADYAEMFKFCNKFGIKPMVETFDMSDVNAAFHKMRRNELRYRAVLRIPHC